jgi:hypothetical protein
VRDFTYSYDVDGYAGNDLSILANHLLKGKTILDWGYQQTPDSIIWAVRDDGELIGLTYYKEHEVWGWHRHDTDGNFESVAVLNESKNYDATYFVVAREIDGVEMRYIEKMRERLPVNLGLNREYVEASADDSFFVDCGLSYDGWNTVDTKTLALSGGTTWKCGETLLLTAAGHAPFTSGSVGRSYKLRTYELDTDTELYIERSITLEVTAYLTTSTVNVTPVNRTVPTALRSLAINDWALMAQTFGGLDYLEGKAIVALSDGNVEKGLTVVSGSVSLSHPAAKAHIGLPYVSEAETLDFEFATERRLHAL